MVKHVFLWDKSMLKDDVIYKISTKDQWRKAQEDGVYLGSKDDKCDGFIHFSTNDQVSATLSKHFNGQIDLLLLKVKIILLDQTILKWEISRNHEKLPHLYGHLNLDAIIEVTEIPNHRDD